MVLQIQDGSLQEYNGAVARIGRAMDSKSIRVGVEAQVEVEYGHLCTGFMARRRTIY